MPVPTSAEVPAVAPWRAAADTYRAARAGLMARARTEVVGAVGLRPGQRVAVLCSGVGREAVLAARLIGPDGSVLAVDNDSAALRRLDAATSGRLPITTQVADVEDLELDAGSLDAILCCFGIHLLRSPELAVTRWITALRPGGRLGLTSWARSGPNDLFAMIAGIAEEVTGSVSAVGGQDHRAHPAPPSATWTVEDEAIFPNPDAFAWSVANGPNLGGRLPRGETAQREFQQRVTAAARAYYGDAPAVERLRCEVSVHTAPRDLHLP